MRTSAVIIGMTLSLAFGVYVGLASPTVSPLDAVTGTLFYAAFGAALVAGYVFLSAAKDLAQKPRP